MTESEPGRVDTEGVQPGRLFAPEPIEPPPVASEEPDVGGDPACWAPRVCPDCGLFVPGEPPIRCPRCGAMVGVD